MVVRRLVRVAPAQALERVAPFRADPDERVVERHARDVRAGLDWCGLHDVAPGVGAVRPAEDGFDEERVRMRELGGERADLVADQAPLERAASRRSR